MIARTVLRSMCQSNQVLAKRFGAVSAKAEAGRFSVTTYKSLDPLVNKIDNDKPHIYCLLFTESWNPLTPQATQLLEEINSRYSGKGLNLYHANADTDRRIGKYFTLDTSPAFLIALYGRRMNVQYGVDLAALQKKIDWVYSYSNSDDILPSARKYASMHQDFLYQWEVIHNKITGETH